jgi:hypothetical protein
VGGQERRRVVEAQEKAEEAHGFERQSDTAAIPEQEDDFVRERRYRSHFAWQVALQSDVRAAVIVRCRHWETFLKV